MDQSLRIPANEVATQSLVHGYKIGGWPNRGRSTPLRRTTVEPVVVAPRQKREPFRDRARTRAQRIEWRLPPVPSRAPCATSASRSRRPCTGRRSWNKVEKRLYLLRLRSLRRHDCVFRGLGYPELHNFLGGDLDGRTRSRVPAHPRLPVHTDQSPDSRNDEQAVLLDLSDGRVGECIQHVLRHFLGDLAAICEGLDDLRLCHCDSPYS